MTGDRAEAGTRFRRVCVVGLGHHARTKLIPALVANGQEIAGLVTGRPRDGLPAAQIFNRLDGALSALAPDTAFVIATPPTMHYEQCMAVIETGHDVFIEKPAFVTEREAVAATAAATQRGSVLVEAFMHRHTELYRRLMRCWRDNRSSIEAIDITFVIPDMPAGTFRQDASLGCSSLYDVGCYALSLLADLDLPLQGIEITGVDSAGDLAKESVRLAGTTGGVAASVRIGVDASYANIVSLQMKDGKTATFSPFFYGRAGQKTVSHRSAPANANEAFHDENAFETMFAVSRGVWIDSQPGRAKRMIEVTATLQRLGETLATLRKSAAL
jgi:hypothetical protein